MGACIAIMAGGTGGHVFPALAVANQLRAEGFEPFWIGTRSGLEASVVPQQGFDIEWLQVSGLRGRGVGQWLRAPWILATALREVKAIFKRRNPAVALGMGGFVSGPGGLMAKISGCPLVIHEQNSVPGLTNQWLSRLADCTFEGFAGTFPAKRGAIYCGNPVRAEILALPAPEQRLAHREGRVRLLVIGGSLGAQALNEQVPAALALLAPAQRPEVWHQTGERTLEHAQQAYHQAQVAAQIVPFISDMAAAYAWADVVICRAGALTLAELAAAGLPSLLVPYPHAVDDHQTANARHLVAAGAAQLLHQATLNAEKLATALTPLLADASLRLTMAQAARSCARPDAVEQIVHDCRTLVAAP